MFPPSLQFPREQPVDFATVRIANPAGLDAGQTTKQTALNCLSHMMEEPADLAAPLKNLQLGLSGPHANLMYDQSDHDILNLFENRKFLGKKCTESGSLALVAFALKTFGHRVLDASGNNIDQHKLEMALNMLFGKDMPAISSDVMGYASRMRLSKQADSQIYTLCSKSGYQIKVTPKAGLALADLEPLVNRDNVNMTYFQKRGAIATAINSFFQHDQFLPSVLSEIEIALNSKKIRIDPDNPAKKISKMCAAMKGNTVIYNRTTRMTAPDGKVTEDGLMLKFLDSAPSIIRDHRDQLRESPDESVQNLNKVPVNLYEAESVHKIGDKEVRSRITCCGSQFSGTTEENIECAGKVVDGIVASASQKRKSHVLIADIRLLAVNTFNGNELEKYNKHIQAFETAALAKKGVVYKPVLQEAHSLFTAGLTRGKIFSTHALTKPKESDDDKGSLKDEVSRLFYQMPINSQDKYGALHVQWRALYDKRDKCENAIPFVTLSKILFSELTEQTNTYVAPLTGCKSAKDRTPAVLTGVALLEPLIQSELEKPVRERRLERFFTPHFDYEALTPDEKSRFKKLFDLSLLQSVSKFNTGAATNVNTHVLKEYFKDVPVIQECDAETVRVGG